MSNHGRGGTAVAHGTRLTGVVVLLFLLSGCLGIPDNASAVDGFELERYLGKWYEVARLDHRFERGLTHVTAEYSLREDGGVRVINSGFDTESGTWSVAEGKAYFIDEPDIGRLKVSFFGPFYGAYNIVELDRERYRYAMVIGPNTGYLWILSRTPKLDPAIIERLKTRARELGFAVEQLIFPEHGDLATMTEKTVMNMSANEWLAVHDRVMGGVSDGSMIETDEGLRFQGRLSLDNNGGFASVRRRVQHDLSGVDRIRLRVRGDGRRYQIRLRHDNNWDGVAWREQFDTDGTWQDIEVAFDEFEPVFRGRRVSGYGKLDASRIGQLGLMLADGTPGTFQLDVGSVEFLRF